MKEPKKILVTGSHGSPDLDEDSQWVSLPVLRFEPIPLSQDTIEQLCWKPVDWMIFSSPRAVRYFTQSFLSGGLDFPLETRVACIGSRTATEAEAVGLTPDFTPSEGGTEAFLEAFVPSAVKGKCPSVFLPVAREGRTALRNRLRKLGCEVSWAPVYETVEREDIESRLLAHEGNDFSHVVFTSPSSVKALLRYWEVPESVRVLSIGSFTAAAIEREGIGPVVQIPGSDLNRIGEVL